MKQDLCTRRRAPCVVSVGGGKGGVGKSVVALNLAVALAEERRVVLVDGDLGAPNLHTMLGLGPRTGLDTFFSGHQSIEELAAATGVPRLRLVSGAFRFEAADIGERQREKLVAAIDTLDADVVVVDVPAGNGRTAVDLFRAADHRLVVMTPQLPSLENAYLFVKATVLASLREVASASGEGRFIEEVIAARDARLAGALQRLKDSRPGLGERVAAALAGHGIAIVGNMVTGEEQLAALNAMKRMMRDYLTVSVPVLGTLHASPVVRASIDERRPFALDPAAGRLRNELAKIASAITDDAVTRLRAARATGSIRAA